jgi:hypothetical protein
MNREILLQHKKLIPEGRINYLVTENLQEIAECDYIEQAEGRCVDVPPGMDFDLAFMPPHIYCNAYQLFLDNDLSKCINCKKAFTMKGKQLEAITFNFKEAQND